MMESNNKRKVADALISVGRFSVTVLEVFLSNKLLVIGGIILLLWWVGGTGKPSSSKSRRKHKN